MTGGNSKLCPLREGEEPGDADCLEDKCAWWHRAWVRYNPRTESNESIAECAVLTIARESLAR